MLESYDDIRSRIKEPPKWFDCHGVPRYDKFHPSLSPNVYADEVLLYEIECQSCGRLYLVEENWLRIQSCRVDSLSARVKAKRIHYGDPPCFECGPGSTMNCIDRKTVQFWKKCQSGLVWRRVKSLEGIDITPDWAKEE